MAETETKKASAFTGIKNDLKNSSKATKVAVGAGTALVSAGAFFLGRLTKGGKKPAKK